MAQLSFHNNNSGTSIHTHTHTHTQALPIIQRFVSVYKFWSEFQNDFPKKSRHTLGAKIDSLFLDTIELLYIASYLGKEEKVPYLKKAGTKLDLLKFFLQISWETKSLDNKKYVLLSEPINEIGKMLGGWTRQCAKSNPGGNAGAET